MNIQLMQKRSYRSDGMLVVHSIFHTIQGEGPFTGHRATFVRLADCNLQCPNCDTDYTSSRREMSPLEIIEEIYCEGVTPALVVITGGEPFRQDITELCYRLLRNGFHVQVETNGTLPLPTEKFESLCTIQTHRRDSVFIVCSPKTNRLNHTVIPYIGAYKYVIRDGDDYGDGLPCNVLDSSSVGSAVARPPKGYGGPIYIQPEDEHDEERNKRNLRAAVESCMKYGHILQIQIHKLIGVE